jgi:hypothetical protein
MTSVIGIAMSSLQLVLTAYDNVNSNRDRLGALVKRCEIVVDSLQLVVNERGEAYAENIRISRLEQSVVLHFQSVGLNLLRYLELLSTLHLP